MRELGRQIDAALYERVALSRDSAKLLAIEKKGPKRELIRYEDAFKDSYLLNFLGLEDACSEKDLEAAVIQNLQKFLSELWKLRFNKGVLHLAAPAEFDPKRELKLSGWQPTRRA